MNGGHRSIGEKTKLHTAYRKYLLKVSQLAASKSSLPLSSIGEYEHHFFSHSMLINNSAQSNPKDQTSDRSWVIRRPKHTHMVDAYGCTQISLACRCRPTTQADETNNTVQTTKGFMECLVD